jgi:hypothetical protein
MAIAVARREDNPKVVNGYGEVEWLAGTHKLVRGYKCILEKGHTVSPKIYKDKTVVFIFSQGTGYITSPSRAYNIDQLSFFVPNFDTEAYSIYAVTDMEYMMVVTDMLQSDIDGFENTHMVLPSFKTVADCEPYAQSCKGPNTKSWSVLISGHLARVLMGIVKAEGEGTIEKGHPAVDQWNYTLPGSDFELTVDGETIHHGESEWSFVPAGLDHSLTAKPGKTVYYIWFEHKTAEIEKGKH